MDTCLGNTRWHFPALNHAPAVCRRSGIYCVLVRSSFLLLEFFTITPRVVATARVEDVYGPRVPASAPDRFHLDRLSPEPGAVLVRSAVAGVRFFITIQISARGGINSRCTGPVKKWKILSNPAEFLVNVPIRHEGIIYVGFGQCVVISK